MRVLVIVAGLDVAGPTHARVQSQMFCWVTDVEFPVACVEEEDDEEEDDEEAG